MTGDFAGKNAWNIRRQAEANGGVYVGSEGGFVMVFEFTYLPNAREFKTWVESAPEVYLFGYLMPIPQRGLWMLRVVPAKEA